MYCNNCGSEIADGGKFCSNCGAPVAPAAKPEPVIEAAPEPLAEKSAPETPERSVRRMSFDEFQWNVEDYPDRNNIGKTDDVDFNWHADPADIQSVSGRGNTGAAPVSEPPVKEPAPADNDVLQTERIIPKDTDLHNSIFGQDDKSADAEAMSAADRIDKFYTFNRKNEEFQQLLNREYEKVKSGNAIQHELSEAEKNAQERFDARPADSSMEAFLEREGVVKPYQPKAFESDVLQRIEAQEAEKEAKRLEEEARLKAIEEARKEAAEKAKLEEEARKKAEEEAAKLAEIARKKAEEEAKAAEEARIKAEEEARIKAEEEARRRAEEEARLKAEAEAKVRAAEEARLRAEADLKAAQEAARIRAQQEARLAAEAEEKFRAEQERQRLEAEEAQRRLEEKRKKLAEEANQAAAEEEARKVLEQTSRMREEEAAKIKAAVASLRAGVAADPRNEASVEGAGRAVSTMRKDVEEAHQATRNQINEMAKARTAYFAELEEIKEEPVSNGKAGAAAEQAQQRQVTGRATMLSDNDLRKTRVVDKNAILAGLEGATRVSSKKPAPAPASDEDFFNSLDAAAGQQNAPEEPAAAAPTAADELGFVNENKPAEADDLLSQFESISSIDDENNGMQEAEAQNDNYGLENTVVMPHEESTAGIVANDFDNYGNEEAADYINRQRMQRQESAMDDFYGRPGDDDYEDEPLTKKELRAQAKEEKRLEKQKAKEAKAAAKAGRKKGADYSEDDGFDEEESGGKGRIVLKVILVILIVVLAVEVAGMIIKIAAPQSGAAEFIDNQLNKVIQLITGDDETEYSFASEPPRTEPLEDKTELIASQLSKNKNINIRDIAYDPELKYNADEDAEISDLVLSQPMTQVEWGKDENNHTVYYDEEVVGQIIAYESNLVNLRNNGDETVLGMIKEDSELYKKTAALKNKKMNGEFTKLEIGEIRQAGSTYYIWVRETIGTTSKEKVYSMYPESGFVMKMAACYDK
ncbi:MAG: zinc-ribbon domain-containing protein [Bacillota bacterium]|nr:zinc-ribbon domain-containing protein [Bacillota bacterium]